MTVARTQAGKARTLAMVAALALMVASPLSVSSLLLALAPLGIAALVATALVVDFLRPGGGKPS